MGCDIKCDIQNKRNREGENNSLWVDLLVLPPALILDYMFIQIIILILPVLLHTIDLMTKIVLSVIIITAIIGIIVSIPLYYGFVKNLIRAFKSAQKNHDE